MQTQMHFLARLELFDHEKPYAMRFPPKGDTAQSNIVRVAEDIAVADMRPVLEQFNIDRQGFEMVKMQTTMRYEDFDSDDRIDAVYKKEIEGALRKRLKATHVLVLDHAVRRRHHEFPISTGENYKYDQPTAMAHIDFTADEAERMIKRAYGAQAERILGARWQVINVWKPLKGPLRDWPLVICDGRSIDLDHDAMPGDIVYTDWHTENIQIHHNLGQSWWYLNNQMPDELLIFKSADSDGNTVNPCPHAGAFNPAATADDITRESIDCRCIVFYAGLEDWPPLQGDPFVAHF